MNTSAAHPKPQPSRPDPHPVPLVPEFIAHHTSCVLVKAGQAIFRLMEQRLAELDIRTRHYSILKSLSAVGEMSQQEICTLLRIDVATMVASLDDCERLGLANRVRNPEDRRKHLIVITAAGRDLLDRAEAVLDGLDQDVLRVLAAPERSALHALMTEVVSDEVLLPAGSRAAEPPVARSA